MIALVRRHCFLLAAGILLWQGWAASDLSSAAPAPAAGEEAPPPPPVLTGEDLALREASAAPLAPADPFLLRELLLLRAAEEQSLAVASTAPMADAMQTDEPSITFMVRLTLQSTLPDGAHGRAWINGHDLAVGDAIPGIAAANPPVLTAVLGSTVTITWSGSDYLLDLYSAAAIELSVVQEEAQ